MARSRDGWAQTLVYSPAGMARIYVFVDEAGDFTFRRKEGVSRYFMLGKTKAQDHLRADPLRFYKQALYMHLTYVAKHVAGNLDELFVVTSSLQINRKKSAVRQAMEDVVGQASRTTSFRAAFWPASCDPCLQVADYVTWAMQRKYERDDARAYDRIAHHVALEFQPFLKGQTVYY